MIYREKIEIEAPRTNAPNGVLMCAVEYRKGRGYFIDVRPEEREYHGDHIIYAISLRAKGTGFMVEPAARFNRKRLEKIAAAFKDGSHPKHAEYVAAKAACLAANNLALV